MPSDSIGCPDRRGDGVVSVIHLPTPHFAKGAEIRPVRYIKTRRWDHYRVILPHIIFPSTLAPLHLTNSHHGGPTFFNQLG